MSSVTFKEAGQLLAATGLYLYLVMEVPDFASTGAELMGMGLLIWGLDVLGRLGAYGGMRTFVNRMANRTEFRSKSEVRD